MPEQTRQVFISYQRSDIDVAREIRERLVSSGVATWMDLYDIPVGAYWPDEIDKGLSSSDIVVGILSPDAVASRNVKNEWDWALQNEKPLLLLQTHPTAIPHHYVSINFIDATNDTSIALDALLHALEPLVGIETTTASHVPAPAGHHRAAARRFPMAMMLVGREREQLQLNGLIETTVAGHGACVLLGGEAGIGKTALTSWMGWSAEERGMVVLSGGCYDLSTTPPYGPWVEIMRQWQGDARLPTLPLELCPERFGQDTRLPHLVASMTDVLVNAAARYTLTLLLEDIHWADPASLDLLHHLARMCRDTRLLLTVTYRDDEMTRRHPLYRLLPTLSREAGARRITLAALDHNALRALVDTRYRLPDQESARLIDRLAGLTEGNPFFAEEVLQTLEETGGLQQIGDDWVLGDLRTVRIPALVREVIEARLTRLGDEMRGLLEVAAVIGHEVPVSLWQDVTGASELELSDTLERAIATHLVHEAPASDRFHFAHALIRETLYDTIISLRRRWWHRKTGDALADAPNADPDEVAHHLLRAGDQRAFDWLVEAGVRADTRYAWVAAGERFEAAATLIERDVNRQADYAYLLWFAGTFHRYTDLRRARRLVEESVLVAADAGDEHVRLLAEFTAALYQVWDGNIQDGLDAMTIACRGFDAFFRSGRARTYEPPATARRYYGSAIATASSHPVIAQAAVSFADRPFSPQWGTIVMQSAVTGRLSGARAIGEQVGLAWESAPTNPALGDYRFSLGDLYGGLALTYWLLGDPAAARQAAGIALDIYATIGHRYLALHMHVLLLNVHLEYSAEDLAERERCRAGIPAIHVRAVGAIAGAFSTSVATLPLLMIDGAWAEAITAAEAYLDATDERNKLEDDDCHAILAHLAACQGRGSDVAGHVRAILPNGLATQPGTCVFTNALLAQRAAACAALDTDDLPAARDWLDMHDHWLEWSGARSGRVLAHVLWSRYHRLAGELATAETCARTAVAGANNPRQPLALVAALRTLGELLTRTGGTDDAAEYLLESLQLATACAAPFECALSLLALVELDIAVGNAAAYERLAEARAICESLEARPTVERITRLEDRLRSIAPTAGFERA